MLHLHYQTLLSYATMLAFYLHLRSSQKYVEKPTLLQSHPIMQRLLTLKQALTTLEELDFAASDGDDDEDDDDLFDSEDTFDTDMKWDDILKDGSKVWGDDAADLEEDELRELLADAQLAETKKGKKTKEVGEEKTKPSPKKKRKVESEPVFDLEEPEWTSSTRSSSRRQIQEDDSYGEASHLDHADAEDKSARKKSLRFHTSKIETASARRSSARSQAIGGDDDIPYKERKKERELRLQQEAIRRLAKQGGEDLNDEMPEKRKREDSDEGGSSGNESPDDYYNLTKKRSEEKKTKKKDEYEAARAAERCAYDRFRSLGIALMGTFSDPSSLRMRQMDLAHSQEPFSKTEDLHHIARRPFATLVSRNARSSKRPRRRSLLKRPFTRAGWQNREGSMVERNPASPRLSRVLNSVDHPVFLCIWISNILILFWFGCLPMA